MRRHQHRRVVVGRGGVVVDVERDVERDAQHDEPELGQVDAERACGSLQAARQRLPQPRRPVDDGGDDQ